MKKILFVLAIGAFAACADNATESESTTEPGISAPAPEETPAVVDSLDSAAAADSTIAPVPAPAP